MGTELGAWVLVTLGLCSSVDVSVDTVSIDSNSRGYRDVCRAVCCYFLWRDDLVSQLPLLFYDSNVLQSHYTSGLASSDGRPRDALTVSNLNYLVDPASSHMLVSKIKPCMSKYKPQ